MVLAERADNLRNGRRSRGPSPNGQVTSESSSEDETASKRIGTSKTAKTGTYEAEKIRVGRDFQAVCPDLEPIEERKPELLADRALLVWSPTKDIADQKLEEYITVAKDKYGYNGEQALGMLFWHKHDLERAVLDLANFTPFPDEWTVEDKVLFDQAFQFHGKSFHRIRQMLPDKSISSLVKYYYSWKKTKSRSSLMDNKAKKLEHNAENGSEHSNEDSDTEDKKWPIHRGIRRASGSPPRGSAPEEMTHAPQVQNNKQSIGGIKRKTMEGPPIDDLRPPVETNRVNTKWTNDELLLAVQGVRKFGKDFQAISEAIGTKTEAHVRAFFVNYRRRYNLDSVLKSHETEKGQQMEVDTEGILAESSPITVSTATSNRTPPLSPPK